MQELENLLAAGDSIGAFINQARGEFERIIGFEPDPNNRERLEKFRTSLPDSQAQRIELLP